jgi:ketosteroid isomerase-like protein
MSLITRWLTAFLIIVVALLAGSYAPARRVFAAEPASPAHCAGAAYRQFDFWAGNWDVFDVGSPIKVAHAQVDLILDGCVLREDYQGADGHKGQSFTIYDAARDVWHQSWVTNRGQLLEIEGKFEAGTMVLSGEDHAAGSIVRGWWKPVNGEVRETATTSTDGGKTWKPWFDLVFRPVTGVVDKTQAPANEAEPNSEKIGAERAVAALDTQYQAAVKINDAETMARILADDLTLVTGSGKIYSKADLVAEARSGRVHYEQQDDRDQTVRVWGDTAVITAKLWEKGTDDGKPFEYLVWFSDTYVRTPAGWRYVFGQSSCPCPKVSN